MQVNGKNSSRASARNLALKYVEQLRLHKALKPPIMSPDIAFNIYAIGRLVYSTCWRKAKGIHIHDLREAPFATKCSGRSPQRTSGKNGPAPIRDKHFIDSRKQETVVRQCWIVRLIFSSLLLHQARLPDQPDAMR